MRRYSLVLCVLAVLLIVAGCGSKKDVGGKAPDDVPVQWMNAGIQKNEKWMYNHLIKKSDVKDVLDKTKGAQNEKKVKHYKLIRWKKDNDTYFYRAIYKNPVSGEPRKEFMVIVRTDQGWKRDDYYDTGPHSYQQRVVGLKKKVLNK